jgi:hypothetical protein
MDMKTTSPKSSDVRQWARSKGIDVGERGRLSPDVLAAYSAAHGGATVKPTAKKTTRKAVKKAPAKKAAAKKTTDRKAPAKRAAAAKAVPAPAESSRPVFRQPETITAPPVVTVDSARVTALEESIAKLASRLERLEAAKASSPKRGLFARK